MTATISDLGFGTSRILGRYFRLVSAVPTALLVTYLVLLIASGAWTHRPDFRAGIDALTSASVGKIIGLLGATLAVALVLHTVQFTLVQLLEGYWGGNRVMCSLRTRRTLYHLTRRREAHASYRKAFAHLAPGRESVDGRLRVSFTNSSSPEARIHVAALTRCADAQRVVNIYPGKLEHVMPTRLGNLLRKYEVEAGIVYKIDILQKATHLALVAPKNHVEYLNERRSGLDLAVRLCASGIIASLATALLMWPWDVWLLLTAVPYALAYVSYRGALVAAIHYGDALAALVDLNRFGMYEKLHQRLPDNTIKERAQNILMSAVIAVLEPGGKPVSVTYKHPTTPPTETPTPPEEHPSGD